MIRQKHIIISCLVLCLLASLNSCFNYKKKLEKPKLYEYNLICDTAEFNQLYNIDYRTNRYIYIKICYKNDTISAKLRIRGDSSRDFPKKSLKIICDSIMFPRHNKVLNFNAEYSDKGYIREYLSSKLMQASGQPCFDTDFAAISINGKFLGLYLKIENVDNEFLSRRGLNPKGNLYKASKDGACMSIYDELNKHWEKKTNKKTGINDLKMLIDSVNYISDFDYYQFILKTFEYEKLINIIAMNMLLQNKSTYYHNYYLYHDPSTNKWTMFPWDMDKTLSYYNYDYEYYETTNVHWISANPLINRALICPPIFEDIKSRVKILSADLFNSQIIDPVIENLHKLLAKYVAADETDNTDPVTFEKILSIESNYFKNQYLKLTNQFENYPATFSIISTNNVFIDQVYLRWHSSKSPQGKTVSYNLIYGTDYMLKDSTQTTKISGLTDTIAVIDGLKKDKKYYWEVIATDGQYETPAFNTLNYFIIKEPIIVGNDENTDTFLLKQTQSPYLIQKDICFKNNQVLIVDKGVIIYMAQGVSFNVFGRVEIRGTLSEPVIIQPLKIREPWGIFYLIGSDKSYMQNMQIINGNLSCINSNLSMDYVKFDIVSGNYGLGAIVYMRGGFLDINHSLILGNDTTEAFVFEKGSASVKNSFFIHTGDAIEYMGFDSGEIINNYFYISNDEGIDFNGSHNIKVKGNFIFHTKGSGVSVGNDKYGRSSNILIENNVLVECNKGGVSVKDSSDAKIINNTFYNMDYGVMVFRKTDSIGGGKSYISNCIFSNITKNVIYYDKFSEVDLEYCLADNGNMLCKNCIIANPGFVDEKKFDFRLNKDSPAINKGDPRFQKDLDGTRIDIGAIYYKKR